MESSSVKKRPYHLVEKEFKNKCFSKDLVISFPMSEKQKDYVLNSIKRYEKSDGSDTDSLNAFEIFQCCINAHSFYYKESYSFLLCSNVLNWAPSKSDFKLSGVADLGHLFQLVKRDKSGVLFKTFKKQFINDHKLLKINDNSKEFQNIFGKINEDGSLDMKYIKYTSAWSNVELLISEANLSNCTFNSTKRSFNYPYVKLFEETKSNLENRPPSLNQWGVIREDEIYQTSFILPTFKEICISVLKEMFLINRKVIIEKIKNLPKIILIDFINSCFEDEKPVGQEILLELYKYFMKSSDGINFNQVDELFPLEKFIKSGIKREEWFRYNYTNSIMQDIFYPHYKDKFAINVYENQYLFKKRNLPFELENQVLFKCKELNTSDDNDKGVGLSIVDKEKFIENFHKVTNNMFEDLSKVPQGIIFIGGIVTKCLSHNFDQVEDAYSSSDIDVCYYGMNSYDAISQFVDIYFGSEKVKCEYDEEGAFYEEGSLNDDEFFKYSCSITKLDNHITISKHYPFRHVQINIYPYRSIEEVLIGVDIDASCFAFNGEDLFCLERGMHAMNYEMNIASNHSYLVREDGYQLRLIKYLDRGFNIFYISSKAIQEMVNNIKFTPSSSKVGFSLLYSAKLSKEVLKDVKKDIQYDDSKQPYGPEWNKTNYDIFVSSTSDELYDGYGSEKNFRYLLHSIGEQLHDYDSDRYNFTNSNWEVDYTNEEIIYYQRNNYYSNSYIKDQIREKYYEVLNSFKNK